MRIPLIEEAKFVEEALNVPTEYTMACYIGIGYPTEETLGLQQNEYSAAQKLHMGKW